MGLLRNAQDLVERTGISLPAAKKFITSHQTEILESIRRGAKATDAGHAVFVKLTGAVKRAEPKTEPMKAPAPVAAAPRKPEPAPKVVDAPKATPSKPPVNVPEPSKRSPSNKTTVITPPKKADDKK